VSFILIVSVATTAVGEAEMKDAAELVMIDDD
jgi:hypothetical protein